MEVTKHAIKKFKERLNENQNLDNNIVKDIIENIFLEANYVSDNSRGILFRNNKLKIELIVKDRKIITIYTIKDGRENGNSIKNYK